MLLMKPELLDGLETPEGLQGALQVAIELELSTLPPYLYAMFSLQPNSNTEIRALVDSVVKNEMAHMALACNILNAIEGTPKLGTPEVTPRYPGHLPGTVEDQLTVHLRAFSIPQVESTFMVIEEPEEPLNIPDEAAIQRLTIGEFYAEIERRLNEAGPSIFSGDPSKQLKVGFPEIKAVTDFASASAAINTIVEQGEGTSTSPVGGQAANELAHYYRFAEITHGKKLIEAEGEKPPWRYDGDPIPFDPTSVYPLKENPHCSEYPAGSPARHGCEECNYTYTTILKVLNETFNGEPNKLWDAVNKMSELASQAEKLVTIPLQAGINAGPSFEYQPNPPT
jgi:hypothetical protein